uniref:SH3 domain-containing protein n=1 Tax=Anopheles culicifacies TaxID=139723 RepID=A0A182M672_9DIPT
MSPRSERHHRDQSQPNANTTSSSNSEIPPTLQKVDNMHLIFGFLLSFQKLLAKATFDNIAESTDELAFRKGETLTVIETDTNGLKGWWLCQLRGRQVEIHLLHFPPEINPGGNLPKQLRRRQFARRFSYTSPVVVAVSGNMMPDPMGSQKLQVLRKGCSKVLDIQIKKPHTLHGTVYLRP